MKMNAVGLTFLAPNKINEFGSATNLKGIFKIKFVLIAKTLGWFLKHEENDKNITWVEHNSIANTKNDTLNTVILGKSIIDGSHPIDDLELPLKSSLFGTNKEFCNISDFIKFVNIAISNNQNNNTYVIDENCDPIEFIKEVRFNLKIESYDSFKKAFDWLTKKRYTRDILSNQREMLSKLAKNPPRSNQAFDACITEYYYEIEQKISISKSNLLSEFLPFDDAEALAYFWETLGSNMTIVSSRLIRSMTNYEPITFKDFETCLIGYMTVPVGNNLLLYHYKVAIEHYSITCKDTNFDNFDINIVDGIFKSDGTGALISKLENNLVSSCAAITRIETALGKEDSIPGCVTDINFKELEIAIGLISNNGYSELKISQLSDSLSCKNGFFNNSATIHLDSNCNRHVLFDSSIVNTIDFTHNNITNFHFILNEIMMSLPAWDKNKDISQKIDLRMENLAERCANLYSIIESYIKHLVIYCLDVKTIDRPFLMLEKIEQSVQLNISKKSEINAGSLIPKDCVDKKKQAKFQNQVILDYKCLPIFISIKGILKTWSNVFDKLEALRHEVNLPLCCSNIHDDFTFSNAFIFLESAYNFICKENNIVPFNFFDTQGKFKTSLEYTIKKSYKINIGILNKNSLFDIFTYCVMHNMVENDTFININNQELKLVSNKDLINSIFREQKYYSFKLLKSIYDEPNIERKWHSKNSE